jgi:mono/diheme cytochrome c family protein
MRTTANKRGSIWLRVALGLVVLGGLIGTFAWYEFCRQEPQHFDTMEEAFKYGSIGTEEAEGMPYWIWMVLPRLFPQYLPGPGGYASLGVLWEEGHETPIGFSKRTIGFPRIGINCALCHTGSYRTDPAMPPTIVATAPATRLDVLAYQRFMFNCASDSSFTADNILPLIDYNVKLSPVQKLLYRYLIIPQTRSALLKAKERFAWTDSRPNWGRGRIDPFNPVKFHQLGMDSSKDPSIGNSDMEPLWNRAPRAGHALHWDGLNDSLTEVVLSGALGDGATPKSLPVAYLHQLENWLGDQQPPKYPYPINWKIVSAGQRIYQSKCATCHAFGGERTGQVIPVAEVGTDEHRLGMWSQDAANRYNNYAAQYPWRFSHFVKKDGYVAVPLDGLWLRAPYLHNGSVPTLEDLLEPQKNRTKVFYRGYDVYDRDRMGFISSGPEAEQFGFQYDTSEAGNSNAGHEGESYGTTLPPDAKRALIEFLKTQ